MGPVPLSQRRDFVFFPVPFALTAGRETIKSGRPVIRGN